MPCDPSHKVTSCVLANQKKAGIVLSSSSSMITLGVFCLFFFLAFSYLLELAGGYYENCRDKMEGG